MRIRIGGSILALGVAAVLAAGSSSRAAAPELKFLMDWVAGGKHVGFYVAQEQGFFKKNGLNVKILQGRGSTKSARMIDTKQVAYSYGDLMTASKLISKGGRIQAVGVVMASQPGGYLFLGRSGIKTPKDLEGKITGDPPTSVGRVLLPVLADKAGFDHTKIIFKGMKMSIITAALFAGKIDFHTGFRGSNIPRIRLLAERRGLKFGVLYFKDMGLDNYGHVVQTHADRIRTNPKEVQKFVSAVFDGWAWAIAHPKGALDHYLRANPEKDREVSAVEIPETLEDIQDPDVRARGLGYMKEAKMKMTVALANKYFKLSPAVDYKKIYTNRFIRPNPGM